MKRLVRALVLVCLAGPPAYAADLLDIYRQAQANDPTWLAAQANHRAVLEQVPQARAGLLPSVDLTANVFENGQQVKTPATNNNYDFGSKGYALELVQPIYNRPRSAGYGQALAVATQADFELALARQDLIVRSARAYLAVLSAREALEHARAEKSAVQRLLALARRNFNVGAASLIDVHDAQAAYDLATSQEITATNDLETARHALRVLTGNEPGELAGLGGPIEPSLPEPQDIERWVAAAVAQNPSIKVREQIVEQATQEIERSRGQHYPTLDFVVARNYNDTFSNNSGAPLETTTDQLGVRFRMPLYQSGAISARVREAIARRDATEQQLEVTRRQLAQQARAAYLAIMNGMAQVRALEQARASNQRALESTVLGQERGLRTGLDVLNNQRTLFRTLRDLARARYDYILSRLQLEAVAGTADDKDVIDINQLLATTR